MAYTQVVETSVADNGLSQDSNHPDDPSPSRYAIIMLAWIGLHNVLEVIYSANCSLTFILELSITMNESTN